MTWQTEGKRLHYRTQFAKPEAWQETETGYRRLKAVPEGPGNFGFTVRVGEGEVARFYIRDDATGTEDHPPAGGNYVLPADMEEAWLALGVVFDVEPTRVPFELIDGHTHPYERAAGDTFVYDPRPILNLMADQGIGMALTMTKGPLQEQKDRLVALCSDHPWLVPLVWVEPNRDSAVEVEVLLRDYGFRGLKFHPTVDKYPADGPKMDAFMALAAKYNVPVQYHSATDDRSRPERIAAIATRFPTVAVIMVHAELGAIKKSRAFQTIKNLPNIIAETSWTNPESILEAMAVLGSHRTMFGTDATVDGFEHYLRMSIADPRGHLVYSIPAVIAGVKEEAAYQDYANWAALTAVRLYDLRFKPVLDFAARKQAHVNAQAQSK